MSVVWLVWDAAAAWTVDRLESDGALPAVSRLRADGVTAQGRPPRPNCQTPAGLATLFTGTSAQDHGITGFDVPSGDGQRVDGYGPGFAPGRLRRPPVWKRLLAAGGTLTSVHAPWVVDADGAVEERVTAAVEAYSQRVARSAVLPLPPAATADAAGTAATATSGFALGWPVRDIPVMVTATADGAAVVRSPLGDVTVADDDGWVQVPLPGGSGFWCAHVALADGGAGLVRTGSWMPRAAGTDVRLVTQLKAGCVFAGEGVRRLYRNGAFGPRLVEGGSGGAEEVFVGSLGAVAASFTAAARAALAAPLSDLVIIYLPFTDDVGHELLGWCDPASAAYRPELAERVWPLVRTVFGWADDVLATVLDATGPDDTVVLSADHGIVGSAWLVYPNEILASAGLLRPDAAGRIDISASAAVYSPANNGAVLVNHDGRPGGTVPRGQAGAVLAQAMTALLAVPPPDGIPGPVVRGFVDPCGVPLDPSTTPPGLDTAYLVLSEDYQPSGGVDGGTWLRSMAKSAGHLVTTDDPRLYATLTARGPAMPPGAQLGVVDNTLVARLVETALRLPPDP